MKSSSGCSSVPPTYGLSLGSLASIILHWQSESAHGHPASAVWLASSGPRRCWVNPPWSTRPLPGVTQNNNKHEFFYWTEEILLAHIQPSSVSCLRARRHSGAQYSCSEILEQWKVTLGGIRFRQSTLGHILECDSESWHSAVLSHVHILLCYCITWNVYGRCSYIDSSLYNKYLKIFST